jgi:hypothetical protein
MILGFKESSCLEGIFKILISSSFSISFNTESRLTLPGSDFRKEKLIDSVLSSRQ